MEILLAPARSSGSFVITDLYLMRLIMAMLIISGPAHAYAKNPRSSKPITDRKALARFHGLASEEGCAEIFDDEDLNNLRLSGGRLRFVLDERTPALRIVTAFRVSRRLTTRNLGVS
jgi:hypothetical protein